MAYTSQIEIQTYMYAQLMPNGVLDATLSGLGVQGVFDWLAVPQNQAFDYITIGDAYELRSDTLGTEGHNHGFYLYASCHIWSTQRGNANPTAMVDRLNTLFCNKDNQPWTLQTLNHVSTELFRANWLYDSAGTIPALHIALQYKIYCVQS